jgi:hypothetical protein
LARGSQGFIKNQLRRLLAIDFGGGHLFEDGFEAMDEFVALVVGLALMLIEKGEDFGGWGGSRNREGL